MSISEKIYKLRTKSGFSQEVFAEKLDVTRQSVQKWESGLSLPTIEKLISIATLFNVSMDYLCHKAASRLKSSPAHVRCKHHIRKLIKGTIL